GSGIAALAGQGRQSSALGWLSLGLGVPGAVAGIGGLVRAGMRGGRQLGEDVTELENIARIRSQGRAKVNLHPQKAGAVRFAKAIGIDEPEYEADGTIKSYFSTGFLNNATGKGDFGILLHAYSESLGGFFYFPGLHKTEVLDLEETLVHFEKKYGIDLRTVGKAQPLALISCFSGGETGLAQKLAKILQRPVRGFGDDEELFVPSLSKILADPVHYGPRRVLEDGIYVNVESQVYFP
ncbi:hypothetical protein ACWKX9_25755, partial [Enterobacter asburiae]